MNHVRAVPLLRPLLRADQAWKADPAVKNTVA